MRAKKGSSFERHICKQLSLWWSNGEREDIFWRSSQSGGRATQRSKKGKTTFGSYGDVAAVDPIGAPLIKMFTIELKRGSSHGCPGDLLDFKEENDKHSWMKCLMQAITAHKAAGSMAWMLICKRDHRIPVVFFSAGVLTWLWPKDCPLYAPHLRMKMNTPAGQFWFVGMSLEDFLEIVTPEQIIQCSTLKI